MCQSAPHTLTGRSPYSQLFDGTEMRGKIPQFSLSSEENPEVRQKDALVKQKIKMYADKRSNAKPSPIEKVIRCCCVRRKAVHRLRASLTLYSRRKEAWYQLREPLMQEWSPEH